MWREGHARGFKRDFTLYTVWQDLKAKKALEDRHFVVDVHGKHLVLSKNSLYIFRKDHPILHGIRSWAVWVTEWKWFERLILLIIAMNCIVLALPAAYNPASATTDAHEALLVCNAVTVLIFLSECTLRIIARGLFMSDAPDPCYLRELQNWLDLIVAISSLLELLLTTDEGANHFVTLVKTFRLLRPLRSFQFIPHVKNIISTLAESIPLLVHWMVLTCLIFSIIAVTGMSLFGVVCWQRCRLIPAPVASANGGLEWPIDPAQPRFCGGRHVCAPTAEGRETYCASPVGYGTAPLQGLDPWSELSQNSGADYGFLGFQNFETAFLTTFRVSMMDDWTDLMYRYQDGAVSAVVVCFFCSVVFIGGLILLSFAPAILCEHFSDIMRRDAAKDWHKRRQISQDILSMKLGELIQEHTQLAKKRKDSQVQEQVRQDLSGMGLKSICLSICSKPLFENFFLVVVIINTVLLALDSHPPIDPVVAEVFENINLICILLFVFEVAIKLIGLGINFWGEHLNTFDFILVALSIVDLFRSGNGAIPALRTLRLLRIYKCEALQVNVPINVLLCVLKKASLATYSFTMFTLLFLFCMTLVGIHFFFEADERVELPRFDGLFWSFMSIFALFSGDAWSKNLVRHARATDQVTASLVLHLTVFIGGRVVLAGLMLGIFAACFANAREELLQNYRQKLHDVREALALELAVEKAEEPCQVSQRKEGEEPEPPSPLWPKDVVKSRKSPKKASARGMNVLRMMQLKQAAMDRHLARGGRITFRRSLPSQATATGSSALVSKRSVNFSKQDSEVHPESINLRAEGSHSAPPAPEPQAPNPSHSEAVPSAPSRLELRRACLAPLRLETSKQHGDAELRPQAQASGRSSFQDLFEWARIAGGGRTVPQVRPAGAPAATWPETTRAPGPRGCGPFVGEVSPRPPDEESPLRPRPDCRPVTAHGAQPPPSQAQAPPLHAEGSRQESASRPQSHQSCSHRAISSPVFEPSIFALIIVSSFCLAFESPYRAPGDKAALMFQIVDIITIAGFTVEMVLKMAAYGFCRSPAGSQPGYFRVGWNWIDFVTVVSGLLDIGLRFMTQEATVLKLLRGVRVLRVLRPFRYMERYRGVKIMLEALITSMPSLMNVAVITMFFYLGFAIFLVNSLKGELWHCSLDPKGTRRPDIVTRADCFASGGEWVNMQSNFDHIGNSLVTLLHVGTGNGWIEVMHAVFNSVGVDHQPRPNSRPIFSLLVIAFIWASNVVLLNLFCGVLVDAYAVAKHQVDGMELLSWHERRWVRMQRTIFFDPSFALPQETQLQGVYLLEARKRFQRIRNSRVFEACLVICIVGNAVTICATHPLLSEGLRIACHAASFVFSVFITLEVCAKIFVLQKDYRRDPWNIYGLVAAVGSDVSVLSDAIDPGNWFVRVIRVFRVLAIMCLVKRARFQRTLLDTLRAVLPGLGIVAGLLGLVLFMFACLGVGLFGTLHSGDVLGTDVHFHGFAAAFLLLVRAATGDRWHLLMYDAVSDLPGCTRAPQTPQDLSRDGPSGCGTFLGYPYFLAFVLVVCTVLMKLFTAVVLDTFHDVYQLESLEIFERQMWSLSKAWKQRDTPFRGFLQLDDVVSLLLDIPEPVGFGRAGVTARHVLHQMRFMPLHPGRMVNFHDVVMLSAGRSSLWLRQDYETDLDSVHFEASTLERWHRAFARLQGETSRRHSINSLCSSVDGMADTLHDRHLTSRVGVLEQHDTLVGHLIVVKNIQAYCERMRQDWAKDAAAGRRRGSEAATRAKRRRSMQLSTMLKPKPQTVEVTITSARGLREADTFSHSDSFCRCMIPGKPKQWIQTQVISSTEPVWNHVGELTNFVPGDPLEFIVYDDDAGMGSNDLLGRALLKTKVFQWEGFEGELPLQDAGKTPGAFLNISVKLQPPADDKSDKPLGVRAKLDTPAPQPNFLRTELLSPRGPSITPLSLLPWPPLTSD